MASQIFEFTIKTSDPEALKEAAELVNKNFGDAGNEETAEYYLARKAEEYIQQIIVNKTAEIATQTTYADAARKAKEATEVKQRKDKPKEIPAPPADDGPVKVFG